jgi:hypothetical protein
MKEKKTMGYVQLILDNRKKKAQGAAPLASTNSVTPLPDLPGLHRREKVQENAIVNHKKAYNAALKELRTMNKVKKAMIQGGKKKEMGQAIKRTKQMMADLLTKIGTYTDDERKYGFKENGDGF